MRRLLIVVFVCAATLTAAQEGWEPLRGAAAPGEPPRAISEALAVLKRARPFSPPIGFRVSPAYERAARIAVDPVLGGPPAERLIAAIVISGVHPPPASLTVAVDDPFAILGEPLIVDADGFIYLLPPSVAGPGGRTTWLRSAHPAGFPATFPPSAMMPLWGEASEPFYRSVVRPHYGLQRSAAVALFTRNDRPYWTPISTERWIRALLERARAELADVRGGAEYFVTNEQTQQQIRQLRAHYARLKAAYTDEAIDEQYDTLVRNAEAGRRFAAARGDASADEEFEKLIANAAQMREQMRAMYGDLVARFDEQEQQMIDALLARDDVINRIEQAIAAGAWDELDRLGEAHRLPAVAVLADAGRHIAKLEAELASLSPAQRREPAYGFEVPQHHPLGAHRTVVSVPFELTRPSGLVDRGAPGARALVAIDRSFFELSRPAGAPALLAVVYWQEHEPWEILERGGIARPAGRTMFADLWESLDWQALARLVR